MCVKKPSWEKILRYIEVDVTAGLNTDWEVVKLFEANEEPYEVTVVTSGTPDGRVGLCQVTGWSKQGPVPAYAVRVGDSGDGEVILIFGGDEGIRLKEDGSIEPWDVSNSAQWGEPCLLFPKDSETR